MSDFIPRDILPDLWEEILKRHWTFLETEESIEKIEERKKLEGCLKEFLCIVPHDRKFFLPETGHVLRKSIREMDEFTAYKAIIGFDSISQYANNLFTKPWRKEFRTLKMYSGFYQHEVKSNLLDAERLFEAMGYRRLSDQVLILEGPICPDQVTNVSRDAMAAYVECQIMKKIYTGIVAMGLSCTWQDVFHFREKYIGGSSQAIKGLAYAIQERRLRKEKVVNTENCYATIQHTTQVPPTSDSPLLAQCSNCAPYHMQSHYMPSQQPSSQCMLHNAPVNACALHSTPYNGRLGVNGKLIASYPAAGYQQHTCMPAGAQLPHMSHSRSLEHYSEPPALLPHRHSFDQQPQSCSAAHYYNQHPLHQPQHHLYESPYDCLDGVSVGGSSVSYAAVASASTAGVGNSNVNAAYEHPYNVSGNRYPLPYNISNQLNSHYATPTQKSNTAIKSNHVYNSVEPAYAAVTKTHNCNYHTQPPMPPLRQTSTNHITNPASKDFASFKQRSFPPDQQLIDFDDRAPLTAHDFHDQLHSMSQKNSFDYDQDRMYDYHGRGDRRTKNRIQNTAVSIPHQPYSDETCCSSEYARPLARNNKTKSAMASISTTAKQLRNPELIQDSMDNNRKMQKELKERAVIIVNGSSGSRRKYATNDIDREISDVSYDDSAIDDFVNVGHSEHPHRTSQASKNQDGVGSFESWDYVFQNLERSGYSKDLGERDDLLVQGLDLDSLNLGNGVVKGTEKRRANAPTEIKTGRQLNGEKLKTLDNSVSVAKPEGKLSSIKQEKSILKQQNTLNGSKKPKSVLKTTAKTIANKILPANVNNNNSNSNSNSNGNVHSNSNGFINVDTPMQQSTRASDTTSAKRSTIANTTSRASSSTKQGPKVPATTVVVSSPDEWSCRFCTFLNPNAVRICEMCSRSKDFNLEATVSNRPTCV